MKKLLSSEIRKNVFRLLSANVISQIIGLAVYPLVTRLYSPEEFGLFNIFNTLCSIAFIVATGRYEYAIVLPKSNKDAAALAVLCVKLGGIASVFLFILLYLFRLSGISLFQMELLGSQLYLIPPLVIINSLGVAGVFWFNRFKKFGLVGRYWVSQNLVNSFLKVVLGYFKQTAHGLNYSLFLGILAGNISFLTSKNISRTLRQWAAVKNKQIKAVAKTYQNYPKYNLPHAFTNILSMSFPVLLFGHFFGNEMVGFYGLAILVGFRPLNIVVNSLNQVLYQQMSSLYNKKEPVYHLFRKFCVKSFLFLLPVFVLIYFTSVPLIEYFFGEKWVESAHMLNILLPWLLACFIAGVFEFLPSIFFCQKKAFVIEICYAIMRLVAILTGIFLNDYYIGLIIYSWVGVGFRLYQLVWFKQLLQKYEQDRLTKMEE